jgi:hypothetical protein
MCLLAQNYSLCVLRLKFTGYEYVPLICQKYILQLRKKENGSGGRQKTARGAVAMASSEKGTKGYHCFLNFR